MYGFDFSSLRFLSQNMTDFYVAGATNISQFSYEWYNLHVFLHTSCFGNKYKLKIEFFSSPESYKAEIKPTQTINCSLFIFEDNQEDSTLEKCLDIIHIKKKERKDFSVSYGKISKFT